MRLAFLIFLSFLSISPILSKTWKQLTLASIAFSGSAFVLFLDINHELSDPNFDDSAGAAIVSLIPIALISLFSLCFF